MQEPIRLTTMLSELLAKLLTKLQEPQSAVVFAGALQQQGTII